MILLLYYYSYFRPLPGLGIGRGLDLRKSCNGYNSANIDEIPIKFFYLKAQDMCKV